MVEVDFEAMTREFFECAEDFLRAPDFAKGMALHDLAARIAVACNARVPDPDRLVGVFHDFKRAIPHQDRAKLAALLARIREAVSAGG